MIQVQELGCLTFVSFRQTECLLKIKDLERPFKALQIYTGLVNGSK